MIRLMHALALNDLIRDKDVDKLLLYIDHLEQTVMDLHLGIEQSAKKVGATVPKIERTWRGPRETD